MATKTQRGYKPRRRASERFAGLNSYPLDDAITAPDLVWLRLLDGESPLRVWREFRHVTREDLADALNVDRLLIVALEHESAPMPADLLERIGTILSIPPNALVRMVDKKAN